MTLNAHTSYPNTQTYVLRLHRHASPQQGRIVGRLEHVASGHQFIFTTADELIACVKCAAALAAATTTAAAKAKTPGAADNGEQAS